MTPRAWKASPPLRNWTRWACAVRIPASSSSKTAKFQVEFDHRTFYSECLSCSLSGEYTRQGEPWCVRFDERPRIRTSRTCCGTCWVKFVDLSHDHNSIVSSVFRLMQACCDVAFDYAHVRKQFNQPIGTFQVGLGSFSSLLSPEYDSVIARENGGYVHHAERLSLVPVHDCSGRGSKFRQQQGQRGHVAAGQPLLLVVCCRIVLVSFCTALRKRRRCVSMAYRFSVGMVTSMIIQRAVFYATLNCTRSAREPVKSDDFSLAVRSTASTGSNHRSRPRDHSDFYETRPHVNVDFSKK